MRMLAWLVAVMTVPAIASAAPPEVEAAYEKGTVGIDGGSSLAEVSALHEGDALGSGTTTLTPEEWASLMDDKCSRDEGQLYRVITIQRVVILDKSTAALPAPHQRSFDSHFLLCDYF